LPAIVEEPAEGVEHLFTYTQAFADVSTSVIVSTGRIVLRPFHDLYYLLRFCVSALT
jgi:hypothetical protein